MCPMWGRNNGPARIEGGWLKQNTDMQEQSRLAGRYEIMESLGVDRGAELISARSCSSGRPVRIQLLPAENFDSQEDVDKCLAEIRCAAGLFDPHAQRITDHGITDSGEIFVVTDPPEGESLRVLLDREEKLAPEQALELAAKIAAALKEAHAVGVVHGALCPLSVMVIRDPEGTQSIRIGDYGVGRWMLPEQRPTTPEAGGVDPLDYAAPEVDGSTADEDDESAAGEPTPRSDLYAIAAILFEMTTGRRAAEAAKDGRKSRRNWVQSLWEVPVGGLIPPTLDSLLARTLARAPEDRIPSAGVFIELIEQAQDESQSETPTVPLRKLSEYRRATEMASKTALKAAAAPTSAPPAPTPPQRGIRPTALLASVGGLLVFVVIGVLLWLDLLTLPFLPERVRPTPPPPVAPPAPVELDPGAEPAIPPDEDRPCITVSSIPPGAELREADELLGRTPHKLCGPEKGAQTELVLSLPGYTDKTLTVVFGEEKQREIVLEEAIDPDIDPDDDEPKTDPTVKEPGEEIGVPSDEDAPKVEPTPQERPRRPARPRPERRERPAPRPEPRRPPPSPPPVDLPAPDF